MALILYSKYKIQMMIPLQYLLIHTESVLVMAVDQYVANFVMPVTHSAVVNKYS